MTASAVDRGDARSGAGGSRSAGVPAPRPSAWDGSPAFVDPADPEVAARRRLWRIQELVSDTAEIFEELRTLIGEARESRDHEILGYSSWTGYVSEALSGIAVADKDDRRELVTFLANQGMSNRAIAPIIGADEITVRRDLASSTATNVAVETRPAITGLNGKTYTPPKPPTVIIPPAPPETEEQRAARKAAEEQRDAHALLGRILDLIMTVPSHLDGWAARLGEVDEPTKVRISKAGTALHELRRRLR